MKDKIKKIKVVGNPNQIITKVKIRKFPKRFSGIYKGKGIKSEVFFDIRD